MKLWAAAMDVALHVLRSRWGGPASRVSGVTNYGCGVPASHKA